MLSRSLVSILFTIFIFIAIVQGQESSSSSSSSSTGAESVSSSDVASSSAISSSSSSVINNNNDTSSSSLSSSYISSSSSTADSNSTTATESNNIVVNWYNNLNNLDRTIFVVGVSIAGLLLAVSCCYVMASRGYVQGVFAAAVRVRDRAIEYTKVKN